MTRRLDNVMLGNGFIGNGGDSSLMRTGAGGVKTAPFTVVFRLMSAGGASRARVASSTPLHLTLAAMGPSAVGTLAWNLFILPDSKLLGAS